MKSTKRAYWIWMLLLSAGFQLPAMRGQGLLFDDGSYASIPVLPDYGDGGKAENEIISQTPKVDLHPYCPRPGRQEEIFSCTGWALGYGAMSILTAINNHWQGQTDSITRQAYSALFIYNQIRDSSADCQSGTFIGDGLQLLAEKGNLPATEFDRNRNDCNKKPNPEQLTAARQHRIADYARLFDTGAPDRVKIDKTKLCLISRLPVVVGMQLRQNIRYLNADNRYWVPFAGDSTPIGGHAMVVVGYDDGKGAFEIMNSWGEGWGQGGFFWIRYADYARLAWYGFQLTLPAGAGKTQQTMVSAEKPAKAAQPTLTGSWSIRKFTGWQGQEPQFTEAALLPDSAGIYVPSSASGKWPLGQWYQIAVQGFQAGAYLYVLSIDSKENIRVHWPRDGKSDHKFEGRNESAIIALPNIRVLVPNDTTALRLEAPGEEYLCLLFSKAPVPELNQKIGELASSTGPIPERLDRLFAARRIPAGKVSFINKTGSRFETSDRAGDMVLVLIRIQVE